MRFLQSQSEKHAQAPGEQSAPPPDYDVLKIKADALFKFWQEIVFWAVLFAGSFFIFHVIHFSGLVQEEAMEIAVFGRAIALGKDPAEAIILPLYLAPELPLRLYSARLIPPVYPRIQAVFFRIGGVNDGAAVMAGSVFFLTSALLTYALARKLLPKKAALLVFLFTFTNPVLLHAAISGLPATFLAFLFLLIFYGREVLPTRISAAAGGLALGVVFLTDYSGAFFLIPFLLFLIFTAPNRREGWMEGALFLAGFLLAIAPWLIGELAAGRSSFSGSLEYQWKSATALLPGRTADGLYGLSLRSFALPSEQIIGKVHKGISLLFREGLTFSGNFIGLFFWASLFYRPADDRLRRRRLLGSLLLAAGGAWIIVFRQRLEILVPLLPLVIIFGTEFILVLRERFGPRGKIFSGLAAAGFIALNCGPIFFGRVPPDPLQKDTHNSFDYLRSLIREEELVVTDIPARVSWYGNRKAVRIPLNLEMCREMIRQYPAMNFLLLSSRVMERRDIDPAGQWRWLYIQRTWPDAETFDQVMLLPGRLVFMGKKSALLNRISARW